MSESIFLTRKLSDIYREIRSVYLSDNRPWIIGFSGGKDSTCLVQIVWYALSELSKEKLHKNIYVISSDTLVESPKIVERIIGTLDSIEKAAQKTHIPISTNLLRPKITDTFWVRLLGLGYPAPTPMFRWCTEMLKINNADRFIKEKVSEYGEAIVLLGMRKNESTSRNQTMELYKIKNSHLSHHSNFAQTYIYTPLENFTAEDIWNYLLQNNNPWNGHNRDLLSLYQDANAKECPLVIDTSTESCGSGRFGCWTCTVVDQNKTLSNFIDKGEDWLEVLVELREELKKTQDSEMWPIVREKKRRHGRVELKTNGSDEYTPGPYTMEFRKKFLQKLLEGQIRVRQEGPDPNMNLILDEEIHEIQRIWRMEQGDWQNSAYQIYEKVTNKRLKTIEDDKGGFGKLEQELLYQVCSNHNLPSRLVSNLLQLEFETQGAINHSKIFEKIKKILTKEWRNDIDKVVQELVNQRQEKEDVDLDAIDQNNY